MKIDNDAKSSPLWSISNGEGQQKVGIPILCKQVWLVESVGGNNSLLILISSEAIFTK